jgi:hypothetical protein
MGARGAQRLARGSYASTAAAGWVYDSGQCSQALGVKSKPRPAPNSFGADAQDGGEFHGKAQSRPGPTQRASGRQRLPEPAAAASPLSPSPRPKPPAPAGMNSVVGWLTS